MQSGDAVLLFAEENMFESGRSLRSLRPRVHAEPEIFHDLLEPVRVSVSQT